MFPNSAPRRSSDNDGATDSVAENSVVGTTVGITAFSDDADGTDTITYSLDDNDGGRFAIDCVHRNRHRGRGDRPRGRWGQPIDHGASHLDRRFVPDAGLHHRDRRRG